MYKSNRLSMAFNELQLVQKKWTLSEVAVFEKMLVLVGKEKKNRIQINKHALQSELRLGRRALDKSLDRLARAGLLIQIDRLTYSIASIPVILRVYYNQEYMEELRYKLGHYLNKPFGKFTIANESN